MTDGAEEGRVLLREAKRAGVHYLILRIGVPVVAVGGVLVASGVFQRIQDGSPIEAALFGLICGSVVVWAGRALWRMARR